MHSSTFDYIVPTDEQKRAMGAVRLGFAVMAEALEKHLPDGPDKTYVLRKLRECAMWASVAITRQADGSPRE